MINNTNKSRALRSILLSFSSLVYPTATIVDICFLCLRIGRSSLLLPLLQMPVVGWHKYKKPKIQDALQYPGPRVSDSSFSFSLSLLSLLYSCVLIVSLTITLCDNSCHNPHPTPPLHTLLLHSPFSTLERTTLMPSTVWRFFKQAAVVNARGAVIFLQSLNPHPSAQGSHHASARFKHSRNLPGFLISNIQQSCGAHLDTVILDPSCQPRFCPALHSYM